jgi:hypothetical protein
MGPRADFRGTASTTDMLLIDAVLAFMPVASGPVLWQGQ